MLIAIRERAARRSFLLDLADAAAHDRRDKGAAFVYLNKWAQKVRIMNTHYYRAIYVDSLMPIKQVIRELNVALREEGIPTKLSPLSHGDQCRLSDHLAVALDRTELKLKGATGRLTWQDHGWGHQASIVLHDDIDGVHGFIKAGIWWSVEWLNPDARCNDQCTHPRPRLGDGEPDSADR